MKYKGNVISKSNSFVELYGKRSYRSARLYEITGPQGKKDSDSPFLVSVAASKAYINSKIKDKT